MDIDAFTRHLERMMDDVPEALLGDLNGGVTVSPEAHRRQGDPPGVYILGEYITDPHLGALVVLYHGSFAHLLAGLPEGDWVKEMWDTLRHELRHHVEGRAGVNDLGVEDALDLQRLREATQPRRYRFRGRLPRRGRE